MGGLTFQTKKYEVAIIPEKKNVIDVVSILDHLYHSCKDVD